jgi:NDP-hexose-3-ketoreductase
MNLAFLGCGQAARLHSQTLRSCDPTVRRFYASRDPVHAARFVRQFGGAGVCASYEAAIDRPDIDAVLITLPPALHLPWAQRALASGKHVIVEKPAFLSTAEFDVAAGAARAAGRQLLIAENYYYKLLFASLPKG